MLREKGSPSDLLAKTYDLKAAYRQVPVREDNLVFAYFSVYNPSSGLPEVYRMKTLPFGATHSVFSFLRLSRMIFTIATRALFLLVTSFFDDFVLATPQGMTESAASSMELIFMITGWDFAREGRKRTTFSTVCQALGVEFRLDESGERRMFIANTSKRVDDLCKLIGEILSRGTLSRADGLSLRGKLGFADSFLHGRLGALLLKQIVQHVYGSGSEVDPDLRTCLNLMRSRLQTGMPKLVGVSTMLEWFLLTDASYEQSSNTGGLGAVLIDCSGCVVAWYGYNLDREGCRIFGSDSKQTIIYELELLAGVTALSHWCEKISSGMQVLFLDNEAARYSLIRGTAEGPIAACLLRRHLELECSLSLNTWFARVSSESNLSDFPSRGQSHPLLTPELDDSSSAANTLSQWIDHVADRRMGMSSK